MRVWFSFSPLCVGDFQVLLPCACIARQYFNPQLERNAFPSFREEEVNG